ncbi:copper homeostasis protein CutC [Paenibacillus agaridevorans]|uniref:copper homeostasis protein CutC n=1 Tax=Paenibacillus agaridevorans TaxID=171404 RepID=UPI001BE3DB1C|nr:copper homeostasis protein CutC [Paenibacillus agaridevorans]
MLRKLEIIATSPVEALAAERAGADRIELIAAMSEGGLTPSYGTIARTVQAVRIPVRVMVRPHSRSFVYTSDELETMAADIRMIRESGASGLVFGVLTPDGQVDVAAVERLCAEAPKLPLTYHRAIDEARDIAEALRELERIPSVDRVLTSGGHADGAWHARHKLRELQAATPLKLIAAKGLTVEKLETFLEDAEGVNEVHFGTGVRTGGREDSPIDPERVEACARLLGGGQIE